MFSIAYRILNRLSKSKNNSQDTKEKIDKQEYVKIKNFCTLKDTVNK